MLHATIADRDRLQEERDALVDESRAWRAHAEALSVALAAVSAAGVEIPGVDVECLLSATPSPSPYSR